MSKLRTTHKVLRASIARFLCLCHIGLSIYVLFSIKRDFLYLIPLVGAVCLIAESSVVITIFRGQEPTPWFSTSFFIYVTTVVSCYWFLELENIKRALTGVNKSGYKLTMDQLRGDIISNIKIIWSEFELQLFFGLIMIIRWLIPKSNLSPQGLSDLLFKYFAVSCDMLDFLSILQDMTLIKNTHLVYWTLGVWSWSTIQFYLYVPKFEDEEKREFTAYITNSLLSVLFLDLPYFGVRMAAIFGFGSHNYNSYFFATKNIVMILLQFIRIKATFSERKLRQDRAAKRLKDQVGFDKEASKLFDPHEIAKRNFLAERIKKQQLEQQQNKQMSIYQKTPDSIVRRDFSTSETSADRYESLDSMDELNQNSKTKPIKNFEAHQSMKRAIFKESNNSLNRIDNNETDIRVNKPISPRRIYSDEEYEMRPENRVVVNSKPISNNNSYSKNLIIETQPPFQFGGLDKKVDDLDYDDSKYQEYSRQPARQPFMPKSAYSPNRNNGLSTVQRQTPSPPQINQLYTSPKSILKTNNRTKFSPV